MMVPIMKPIVALQINKCANVVVINATAERNLVSHLNLVKLAKPTVFWLSSSSDKILCLYFKLPVNND